MKAKKILMAFVAIAAVSAVSCSQEEELLGNYDSNVNNSEDGAVMFSTYMTSAPESRAAVMDLPALKEKGFGVLGYYTETEDYNIETPNHLPNFMYNQEVTWKAGNADDAEDAEGGMWQYSPVKYWPNNPLEKVSFFAYAPYTGTFGTTGITAITSNTTAGDPKLSFKMDENVDNQIDLLYSNGAINLSKQTIEEKVNFRFKHALSRIGFKRVAVIDENSVENGNEDNGNSELSKHGIALTENSTVVINSVSISSSQFGDNGDFNLRTGEWENYEAKSHTYTLTSENGDFINSTLTPDNATTVMNLTKDDKYLMVMPTPVIDKYSNEDIPVMVTVKFDVITEDPNLAGGQSKITSEVTAPFNFAFQAGKSYNFVLHIGLTSVKLDATVEDWIDTDHRGVEDIVVNTPSNSSYTLVLDALEGRFRNGSEFYVMTKFDLNLETGVVEGAEFKIPYFYNNKSNQDWANPINDIYWQYQLDDYGFTCWCDHIVENLEAPMALDPKYDGDTLYKGYKYYSPTPLIYEDKWEGGLGEGEVIYPDHLIKIPSESSIFIPADDPTRFRILYAVWPIGENHLD